MGLKSLEIGAKSMTMGRVGP